MKHDETDEFWAGWNRLTRREQMLFLQAVRAINQAWARHRGPGLPGWPARLRMHPMVDNAGIWEMTWSFAGPDGRATFEFVEIGGEIGIRWRRIGRHAIFGQP